MNFGPEGEIVVVGGVEREGGKVQVALLQLCVMAANAVRGKEGTHGCGGRGRRQGGGEERKESQASQATYYM